jgi:formylglycine-generating enzyme required for sulfatase activity
VGKYPVTNLQYACFVVAGGYEEPRWRTGRYDSKAPAEWQDWLKQRPPGKRNQPFWWEDRGWNSPLQPVVGVTWFEALAYCAWLTSQLRVSHNGQLVTANLDPEHLEVRLPAEAEWEEAMGRGAYPWGEAFDSTCLNCADAWAGRDLSDWDDWRKWIDSNESQEASITAVTTFPQGSSHARVWDGSGNVWEWMADPYEPRGDTIALRGGSWYHDRRVARVSYRLDLHPVYFGTIVGFRVVVAPV